MLRKTVLLSVACACAANMTGTAMAQDEATATPPETEAPIALPPKAVRRTPPGIDPADLPPVPQRAPGETGPSLENLPKHLVEAKQSTPPSVLVILAHPDDEIVMGPVLARIKREGGKVTLVFATSGDAGPGLSGLEKGQKLAELRESEGRCAAFAMGLDEPTFWQLADDKLGDKARRKGSLAKQALAKTADAIAATRPSVIMTWGPDGGYGHADHRMISAIVTQVVAGMGPERPDLLYSAFPQLEGDVLPEFESWATTHPSLLTDRIHYQPVDLAMTKAALDCYESQFPKAARETLVDLLHDRVWQGTLHFRLAFPTVR